MSAALDAYLVARRAYRDENGNPREGVTDASGRSELYVAECAAAERLARDTGTVPRKCHQHSVYPDGPYCFGDPRLYCESLAQAGHRAAHRARVAS